MRRGRRGGVIGICGICAGVVIILAIILPSTFWWFMLALGLICAGIWYIKSC